MIPYSQVLTPPAAALRKQDNFVVDETAREIAAIGRTD